MSQFDPNIFLHAEQTEVNERRQLLPVENPADSNGLYTAQVGEIKTDSGTIGKGDRSGQPWVSMIVPLKIDVPPELRDSLKLPPQLTLTDRVFLDLTADGRGVDNAPGKNRRQKEYRDALDMNKPGEAFSWDKVTGQVVKVRIVHEQNQDGETFREELPKFGAIFPNN